MVIQILIPFVSTSNQPFHRLYIRNIFFASFTDDECRIIEFKEPIENKAMKDHVIRSAEVINEGSCRVMCYMEPNCVSMNFGPSHGGKYRCELNNATDEDHMTVLEEKPTFTFLAIEVRIFLPVLSVFVAAIVYSVHRNCGLLLRNFFQGD